MNRQFHMEWQEQLPVRKKQVVASKDVPLPRERPKLRLRSLQGLLHEREHNDRLEHRAMRLKKTSSPTTCPIPGWIVYHGTTTGVPQPRETGTTTGTCQTIPSLQSLSLQALAPVLPKYMDAWGAETVHYYLSLLPEDTLADLSVLVSSTIGMTNPLCQVLGQHPHVRALSLVAPQSHDEDDPKALTEDGILQLIPHWGLHRETIPETWEEDTSDIQGSWKGCVKLQRLELGNLPHLSANTLSVLLQKCSGITHLGLVGSLGYESGPEILWKLQDLLPKLKVLDLSSTPWLTEGLLRGLFKSYNRELTVKATGSLPLTSQISMEMDYPHTFWRQPKVLKRI